MAAQVRRKLMHKFLGAILSLIIVGMGCLTFLSYTMSRDALLKSSEREIAHIVEGTIKSMSYWVADRRLDMGNWSTQDVYTSSVQDSFLGRASRKEAAAQMMRLKQEYDYYAGLLLLDKDGQVVASSGVDQIDTNNIQGKEPFSQALAGKNYVSRAFKDGLSGRNVFSISVPVYVKEDVGGVLCGIIDLEAFNKKFIGSVKVGETGYAFVFDRDGVVIAHPDPKQVLNTNLSQLDFGPTMLAKRNGSHLYTYKDVEKYAYLSQDSELGWTAAVGIGTDELYAPAVRIRNINGIMALVVMGLTAIVVYIVARKVVIPIIRAAELADTIRMGDLSERLDANLNDEVGQLSMALNAMADGLEQKARLAEAIANGDLTVEIEPASENDQLGKSLQKMTRVLNDVIQQVMVATENVASGSQALAASSQEMSQGASEQSASAEEASSSIEEMTANIRQNTDNAMQTEKIAVQAAQEAAAGGKAVNETVNAMNQIADKIQIVEEIARQTNLLALNAAIEAARAGEHGKGFAVVAAEVRKLAERSQVAAGEINELSSSSVDVAEEAGRMLESIVPNIRKTAELVQEIAAASREQDAGAEQINVSIQQLDRVIQQNAAATEEMASTSEELTSQSDQLRDMVSFFKVKGLQNDRVSFARPGGTHTGNAKQAAIGAPQEGGRNGQAFTTDIDLDDECESF